MYYILSSGFRGDQKWVRTVLKSWVLHAIRHLHRIGMDTGRLLVRIYVELIRPIFDYACPAYHAILTDSHAEALERLQRSTLKTILVLTPHTRNVCGYLVFLPTTRIPLQGLYSQKKLGEDGLKRRRALCINWEERKRLSRTLPAVISYRMPPFTEWEDSLRNELYDRDELEFEFIWNCISFTVNFCIINSWFIYFDMMAFGLHFVYLSHIYDSK